MVVNLELQVVQKSATAPAGLTWRLVIYGGIPANEQLYAYNGTGFVLVGPSRCRYNSYTDGFPTVVRDTISVNRPTIKAVNDEVVFIISGTTFTIDSADPNNAITGFDVVKKGTTLRNTQNATGGVTSTNDYYWGTASNLSIGGYSATDFALAGSVLFTALVSFADAGILIGDSK